VAYDSASGLLTLQTTAGKSVAGNVTDETQLQWDEDTACPNSDPTTSDLQTGTGVTDIGFMDDGARRSPGLAG
jgi:hypothetical protein